MNELTEKIKEHEEQRGRPMTAIERLNMARSSKADTTETMELVLTETAEGQALAKAFKEEIDKAALVNNMRMRHVAAHVFEAGKKDLLKKFNAGQLERVGPED